MTKAKSKSQEKRLTAQKEAKSPDLALVNAKLLAEIDGLDARIKKLEEKQALIVESFQFIANETRPLFGMGGFALIFDGVHNRLKK